MGVGGFNYIDEDTPDELKRVLLSQRNTHIYTYDVSRRMILLTRKQEQFSLSIDDIEKEIGKLDSNVSEFISLINSI